MRADPRKDRTLLSALSLVSPGTPLRSGIDDIIRAQHGALIVAGEPNDLAFLFSGGMRLDLPLTSQLLYELAKMDGAIIVNGELTKLVYANVQLMPDPNIASNETGTRHRTAERVAKQTGALVISISQQRETVTVFIGDLRYQLGEISDVLARTNQALATLETYRTRLDQGLTRLTALEFQSAVMLDDVLVVLQRAEMTTRMASEIERNRVELGEEGRLIQMQLDELMEDVPREKAAVALRLRALGRSGQRRGRARAARSSPVRAAGRARRDRRAARLPEGGESARPGRLAARLPRAPADPAPARADRPSPRAGLREPRRGHPREPARARGGRGRRRGPREGDPRGPAPPPGAQPRRPLPAALRPLATKALLVASPRAFRHEKAWKVWLFLPSLATLDVVWRGVGRRRAPFCRGRTTCTRSAIRSSTRTTEPVW